ncbi:MAG: hypothetical protein ABL931_09475 [Usitatibacteraceae bacterium]
MMNSLRVCDAFVQLVKPRHLAALTALVLLSGCAAVALPEREPFTLEQIVAMAKEGKPAAAIIQQIKESRTSYDVMASQYAKLSRDGVPDEVLDFMQHGQLRMAERQGRRSAYNDIWFAGPYGYGYGGIWSPRAYFVYVNGRPHTRYW